VSDDTHNVYVEAAFWWPESVMGRGRRYGFSTDAGYRFERGVDPAGTVEHIERITQLILDICGGTAGPMDDQQPAMPQRAPVRLRVERAAKVIGLPVTQAQCADVFSRLGFAFTQGEGTIDVTPPSWRFDLSIEEDLIEEVIRVHGYDKLPSTPPQGAVTARVRPESQRGVHVLRRALAGLGYQEAISYSFVEARWEQELAGNDDPIRVLNPIAAPLAVMRSSLIGSLVDGLRHNLAHRASRVRLFEVGRVYRRDASVAAGDSAVAGIDQPMRVAALAWGSADALQWGSADGAVDFFDIKGDVETLLAPLKARFVAAAHPALHPGRSARIELDGRNVGWVGELHPRWCQRYELPQPAQLFEVELAALLQRPLPQPTALPRFPAAVRDVALVVGDGVTHDALVAALVDDASQLVRSAALFDVFRPKDAASAERSMAVRLTLRDDGGTLTDERIDAAVAQAMERVRTRLNGRLRG
jgi:phenylalanyl-tRNA synthetase beta chain